ncbi:hypothetical protein FOXB_12049 [Fusarium oxysporum f. sp. conglutinans Fo5176]|uniref:Uncharacterized protein n=1 Tax=Fusarium oxysporum (strain Fo5176) TaxID=660025 RepID=F9G067_FUSOF|nr:hypothetical protein FOXB_12049 [Fusarium oxysporum f. sp. conglutinans Fo5176]
MQDRIKICIYKLHFHIALKAMAFGGCLNIHGKVGKGGLIYLQPIRAIQLSATVSVQRQNLKEGL